MSKEKEPIFCWKQSWKITKTLNGSFIVGANMKEKPVWEFKLPLTLNATTCAIFSLGLLLLMQCFLSPQTHREFQLCVSPGPYNLPVCYWMLQQCWRGFCMEGETPVLTICRVSFSFSHSRFLCVIKRCSQTHWDLISEEREAWKYVNKIFSIKYNFVSDFSC